MDDGLDEWDSVNRRSAILSVVRLFKRMLFGFESFVREDFTKNYTRT